jgi:predicted GIY-YIG superfamily endonuclease
MNDTTALYRYFDESGNLLYVGISVAAVRRLEQHKNTKHWFKKLGKIEVENYSTREAALEAEKKAIKAERPKFNKVHNQGRNEWPSISFNDSYYRQYNPPSRTTITPIIENASPYGFSKNWPWKKVSQKEQKVAYKVITEFDTLIDAQIFMSNNKFYNYKINFNAKSGKYVIIESSK